MKRSTTISLIALLLALSSCASVKVHVNNEKKTDFTKYETFSFLSWQDLDDEMFGPDDKKHLEDAFVREFERRGFKRVNTTGDMQVSIYVVTSDQTAYSGYNDYVGRSGSYYHYGGGYGYGYTGAYGSAYGGAYGGAYSGNTYKQRSKLKGNVILDIYDGSNNQIYQIFGESTVEKNYEKREMSTPAKVEKIMRRFPITPQKK